MNQPHNTIDAGKALLALGATAAKALKAESPEALDMLEEYTASFDAWQKTWSQGHGRTHFSTKERELAKRIALQHTSVLELTEKMYRSVQDSLKGLRGRSKGIRAYLDQFPSKISTIRTRRG